MPEETMARVTAAATHLGMTRSAYIAAVLDRVARRKKDDDITRAVNAALAEIGDQDTDTVLRLALARSDAGTEW
jgi:hypothetical protein